MVNVNLFTDYDLLFLITIFILQVYLFLGNLVVSYGIAFIVSIAFESPFMGLEKIMFGGLGKKKK